MNLSRSGVVLAVGVVVMTGEARLYAQPASGPAEESEGQGRDRPSEEPTSSATALEPPARRLNLVPDGEDEAQGSEFFDMTMEELLGGNMVSKARIYGYVRTNAERNFMVPTTGEGGETDHETQPLQWSFPSFHLYGSTRPAERLEVMFNLFGDADEVRIRNAFGNLELGDAFQIRAGLMYRRFDLFNDKLDQSPTFLGIEAPELFDDDHVLVPRSTLVAVHGLIRLASDYELSWMVDTDNAEGGATEDVYPLGADVRIKGPSIVTGISAYASNIGSGESPSPIAVGEGSPPGGILPWMRGDRYFVADGFIEYQRYPLVLQTAVGIAQHSATRDPASVLEVVRNAGITARQRERFLGAAAGMADDQLMADDVVTDVDYTVVTGYLRLGYTFTAGAGTLTPYAHLDGMSHPEVIRNEEFGGDDEAGVSDDGKFWKASLGAVYKPYSQVAIKLDASEHVQEFNGETEVYPEVRFDISFAFNLIE